MVELYSASGQLVRLCPWPSRWKSCRRKTRRFVVTHQLSRQMMYQSLLAMMMAAPDSAEMHMLMAATWAQGDRANRSSSIARHSLNPKLPARTLNWPSSSGRLRMPR